MLYHSQPGHAWLPRRLPGCLGCPAALAAWLPGCPVTWLPGMRVYTQQQIVFHSLSSIPSRSCRTQNHPPGHLNQGREFISYMRVRPLSLPLSLSLRRTPIPPDPLTSSTLRLPLRLFASGTGGFAGCLGQRKARRFGGPGLSPRASLTSWPQDLA